LRDLFEPEKGKNGSYFKVQGGGDRVDSRGGGVGKRGKRAGE